MPARRVDRSRSDPSLENPGWARYDFGSYRGGPVAQLGARLNGIQEVRGSNPLWSTKSSFPAPYPEKQLNACAVAAVSTRAASPFSS